MENLQTIVDNKNAMVQKGMVVEATDQFFADHAKTFDFNNSQTKNKGEELEKMRGFVASIKNVNGITLHHAALSANVSFAEFTFDFDMQDGSKILWHEIIRSVWEDGKIIEEQYFTS